MKKIVLIALVVMLTLAATASVAWATDPVVWRLYAGDSIQAAIDGASDGDTIYVHAGTYDESLVIDGMDLSLIAVGACVNTTHIALLGPRRRHTGLQQRGND